MKITARIKGGIGNQLFCYAAARRLAIANQADLVLDYENGFLRDFEYQQKYQLDHFNIKVSKASGPNILGWPSGRWGFYLRRKINRIIPYSRRTYIEQVGNNFDARLLGLEVKRDLYIDGYWQSEGYFYDIAKTLRADLKIKPPEDDANLRLGEKIDRSNAIAIHIRFFDKLNSVSNRNASIDYYVNALNFIENKFPNSHYYLFSDQPQRAISLLKFPDGRFTCVYHNIGDENAFADLWLMSKCRHFIISNSTFSWWGAWLGGAEGKIVIAPDMNISGVGSWGFEGLLPKEWIKL